MNDNFAKALKYVLVHEGKYVDHPKDPGGATNKGVTLAVFRRYFGESMSKDDLRGITDDQLHHIYKDGYWDTCRCDELPAGIDYVVFDQAVNSGPGRSARWLQKAVNATADGHIGPKTVAASAARDAHRLVDAMCDERLAFLKSLATWDTFGRGWASRVAKVRSQGLTLATGLVDVTPSLDFDIVRSGSTGEWVEKLQRALGVTVDGDFGSGTERALKTFQASAGLEPDGIAGLNTYRALGLVE